MEILLFILGYIACFILSYGILFGYLQNAYPARAYFNYQDDMWQSILFSVFGPLSLFSIVAYVFILSKHGYKGLRFY